MNTRFLLLAGCLVTCQYGFGMKVVRVFRQQMKIKEIKEQLLPVMEMGYPASTPFDTEFFNTATPKWYLTFNVDKNGSRNLTFKCENDKYIEKKITDWIRKKEAE